jgi:hypothetical protein
VKDWDDDEPDGCGTRIIYGIIIAIVALSYGWMIWGWL